MCASEWHAAFDKPLQVDISGFVRERTGIEVPGCRAIIHTAIDHSQGPLWYGRRTEWWPDRVTYCMGDHQIGQDRNELIGFMLNYDRNLPANLFSIIGWAECERLRQEGYN